MRRFKNLFYSVLCSVPLIASGAVFGQENQNPVTLAESVTQLVNPRDVQTQLTTNLGNWLIVGIGIGISVFIVYLGWRLLKRFTRG